jgi:hypothetical protein
MTYVKVLRPTCAQECSGKSDKVTYFVEEYNIEVGCILMTWICFYLNKELHAWNLSLLETAVSGQVFSTIRFRA